MAGRWLLTTSADEPGSLKTQWLEDSDLEDYGIKGEVGEQYHVFFDKSDAKSCIVGEIKGKPAELLNTIVGLIEIFDSSGIASQDLRYKVVDDLVQSVVRAAKRAKI